MQALALSAVVALALTWPVRSLALRIGAVDRPGGRHVHGRTMPTAGGLAIFAGFWIAVLVPYWPPQGPLLGMLVGSGLLLVLCLLDDVYNLSPGPRLVGQLLVAVIAFEFGVRVEGLTNPLSLLGHYHYLALGWLSAPLTVIWIMAITNAINWLDGLDGLVAGVAALAGLTVMLGSLTGAPQMVCLLCWDLVFS
jgi:UDP-GlcNAc:undecaprenyl-phosphate GlcNAc-1-phosphate transferase